MSSPASRLRGWSPYRWWVVGWLALYVVVSLAGVTTSSAGIGSLRDDVAVSPPGLIVGTPRAVRSDEFLRATPWKAGLMEAGDDLFGSPLSYPDVGLVATDATGPTSTLLFFDTTMTVTAGRVAAPIVFAALWWLPVVVVVVLLPWLLRRWGVRLAYGMPATALVVLTPAAAWWTWGPIAVMSWAVLAGAAAFGAADRLRRRGPRDVWLWLLTAVAVLGLARLGLAYTPWALPLGAAVLVPTLVTMLAPRERRRAVVALSVGVVVAAGLVVAAYLLENRAAAEVLAGTVYPGARRVAGGLISLGQLFGAPNLAILQSDPDLVATNQSEISSAFLVLGAAALALVPAVAWRRVGPLFGVAVASAASLGLFALWAMVAWPEAAERLVPLSLVTPSRVGQVLGIPATLTFVVALAAFARARAGSRWGAAASAGGLAFLVTAVGGSALRAGQIPGLRPVEIWVAALLCGAAVFVAVAWSQRRWALVPGVVLAIPLVVSVNPVQAGFADLQSGAAAEAVRSGTESLAPGEWWGSDDFSVDALLMANAAPSISGQQWLGPRESAWLTLDPEGAYRDVWNRGASFILLVWADEGTATSMEAAPTPDLIRVTVDPCDKGLGELGLRRVVSMRPLSNACLSDDSSFTWGGVERYVYTRAS